MNRSRCPHCGVKLGNFLYADACPHCHHELEYNKMIPTSALANVPSAEKAWLIRLFLRVVRFVES